MRWYCYDNWEWMATSLRRLVDLIFSQVRRHKWGRSIGDRTVAEKHFLRMVARVGSFTFVLTGWSLDNGWRHTKCVSTQGHSHTTHPVPMDAYHWSINRKVCPIVLFILTSSWAMFHLAALFIQLPTVGLFVNLTPMSSTLFDRSSSLRPDDLDCFGDNRCWRVCHSIVTSGQSLLEIDVCFQC